MVSTLFCVSLKSLYSNLEKAPNSGCFSKVTAMKATVKFRLSESLKSKVVGGEIKLTCQYSLRNITVLERVLKELYDATGFRPVILKDRHTNIETVWVPLELLEKTLVGRKWLLPKLELLAV